MTCSPTRVETLVNGTDPRDERVGYRVMDRQVDVTEQVTLGGVEPDELGINPKSFERHGKRYVSFVCRSKE
jgi:hypothetical protein